MPEPRVRNRIWLGAALLLALAFQFFVLYTPGSANPRPLPFPGFDKLIHIGIFCLPALLVWLLKRVWWPIALLVVHIPISEFVQQTWIPYRGFDLIDMVADLAGVGLGVLAAALLLHWTKGLRHASRDEANPFQQAEPGDNLER